MSFISFRFINKKIREDLRGAMIKSINTDVRDYVIGKTYFNAKGFEFAFEDRIIIKMLKEFS